ncbi:MAG: cytochrome c3 family protein [Desulfobacterales bacterium]|nr:cytochrome c3 family protein [Desulfobacterales bacterium]
MNKKLLALLAIVFSGLFLLSVGILTAADVPGTITMNSKVYESGAYPKHKKNLFSFGHKMHADKEGVSCNDCHHVYKDGKNVWKEGDAVQKCEACHKEPKAPKGVKMKKAEKIVKYHYSAIHENCKGCHKKMVDKTSEMGKALKKCSGCHPNKK